MSAADGRHEPSAPAARVRTVFCTRGGLHGALVLRRLRACKGIEVCAIVRSTRVFGARHGRVSGALALLRRCGFAYSFYLWCATTLADLLCALAPGGGVPSRTGSIPVHCTSDVNARRGLEFLSRCAPQLLVSAFFDQRLHAAALAIPARGCVNIHPSLLPALRGVDPVLQAQIRATAPLGVTVHWMSPALDDGPMLAQQEVSVPTAASVFTATAQLFQAGAELLVACLDRVVACDPGAAQQGVPSYQGWPGRADVSALHARGRVLMRVADLRACVSSRSA